MADNNHLFSVPVRPKQASLALRTDGRRGWMPLLWTPGQGETAMLRKGAPVNVWPKGDLYLGQTDFSARHRSATNHDSNYAYAITKKRIIMAQKRVIGQTFQTVDIDNMNDITMSTGMLMGVITIDTMKERFNVAVEKSQAMSINKSIHDVLLSLKQKKKKELLNR